jgi:hypothetical protein
MSFKFIKNFVKYEKCDDQLLSLEEEYLYDILYELLTITNRKIQHKSNYLNLDLFEERRYRILNFCAENGYSLAEIRNISITFIKPNYLLLRCSSDILLNIVHTIIGLAGYDNLCKINDLILMLL